METIILIYLILSAISYFPIKKYTKTVAQICHNQYDIKYARCMSIVWAIAFPVVWAVVLTVFVKVYIKTKWRNKC